MKAPGIIDGIVIAIVISLGAGAAKLVLGGFIAHSTLFSLLLCAATLIYLIYLLKRSNARIGRVVVIIGWALASLAGWFFDLLLFEQVLVQAGVIWLVRSLYFHGSMFSAALDFGLVSCGLAASAWAMVNTGSLVGALWSFFLVQALFCWIPQLTRQQAGDLYTTRQNLSSFQCAHRVALDAVRKLTQP
ncbi:MAG: hypothetical protein GY896_13025 [Gammaproteobacteria bacterium]|nr:hypothetical protein [Gammaproteobacteria bacterium]